MNEYQEEVKNTLELLFDAANRAAGRVLDAGAVRRVCSYIQNLVRTLEMRDIAIMGLDDLLAAYTNEYGEELMNTLIAEAEEELEVVDGVIVEEETGFDSENAGLDAQVEGS